MKPKTKTKFQKLQNRHFHLKI